ncbi:MAG: hypothetical protein NPIRA06_09010 [Nitrospirales bacterium]|nr:MAG: hypothetical protein NPIRA06_09010 [Nitrospirales bacterium]
MGGTSLCPEVCRKTFGVIAGYVESHVLDSMVPSQVRVFEQWVELPITLCMVEDIKIHDPTTPVAKRMRQDVGEKARDHFAAINDPGSLL